MNAITKQQRKDLRLIGAFTQLYCAGHHALETRRAVSPAMGVGELRLCPECASFVTYAASKRLTCPLEGEKPSCKRCPIHCYAPGQRETIRKIMAYSGRRMILRGRLDYLWHVIN